MSIFSVSLTSLGTYVHIYAASVVFSNCDRIHVLISIYMHATVFNCDSTIWPYCEHDDKDIYEQRRLKSPRAYWLGMLPIISSPVVLCLKLHAISKRMAHDQSRCYYIYTLIHTLKFHHKNVAQNLNLKYFKLFNIVLTIESD